MDETRTNRELEYRAYVGAKAAVLVPRTDNPAWAEVVIISTNTGRTPALNGRMRYQIEKRQNPLPEDTKLNQPDVQGGKTVYLSLVDMSTTIGLIGTTVADVLMTTQTNPTTQNAARPTKPPKQAQIVPPPATPSLTPPETLHSFVGWYAYGIIDYTDIFGRPHWTKFYFFNLPGTATWVSCPSFNDTDTQQNKAQDNPN
ncbi:MAG: hypothetical protein ABSA41_04400 [Terriglobia bacterium]